MSVYSGPTVIATNSTPDLAQRAERIRGRREEFRGGRVDRPAIRRPEFDVIRKALLRERPGPREIGSDGGVSLQNEPARQIDQRKPDPVQQNRSAG